MANFTEYGTSLKSESRKHIKICQIFQEKCLWLQTLSSSPWPNFLMYKWVFSVAEFLQISGATNGSLAWGPPNSGLINASLFFFLGKWDLEDVAKNKPQESQF